MCDSPAGSARPGTAALTNMALLKAESNIFKMPALPKNKSKNKVKSKVMDEDDYVEGIARIIQRDFFPDLEKLRAQNEYLEAAESKDYLRLHEITRKYSGARPNTQSRGDMSPATFDTPSVHPASPAPDTVRQHHDPDAPHVLGSDDLDEITSKHSLDSYLASHTSEDNASYEKLISLENKRRDLRSASQFEAEVTSVALVNSALMLPSIEQQADQMDRPYELDTWTYKAKNYIMYVPDGDGQPAPVKPQLQHDNTRLHGDPFNTPASKQARQDMEKAKNSLRTGKIGVDGMCEDAPPTVRGLVSTPSPRPGAAGDESPLMTWGEIEGTPFRLDGGDTPLPALGAGRSYRMLEWGARERIGLKLAEQAAKKRRSTTPQMGTPSPRMGTNRLATMSPAARRLATKHLLTPRLKVTPGVRRIPSNVATPKPATPRLVETSQRKPATPKNNVPVDKIVNLTDNLLQINVQKRLKAQDFFT